MAVGEAMQVSPEDAAGGLWPYSHAGAGAQLKRGTPPGQREQTVGTMRSDRLASLIHGHLNFSTTFYLVSTPFTSILF